MGGGRCDLTAEGGGGGLGDLVLRKGDCVKDLICGARLRSSLKNDCEDIAIVEILI